MVQLANDKNKNEDNNPRPNRRGKWVYVIILGAAFLGWYTWRGNLYQGESKEFDELQCPSFEKVRGIAVENTRRLLTDTAVIDSTVRKLQNAVRIPTEISVNIPDPGVYPDNEAWDSFKLLHEQLAKDFPLVWSKLKVEKVNTYSLLITWEGSKRDLKPMMLAAHMDVIPVERKTWHEWKYPPFSGDLKEGAVWGRGAFDNKNKLVASLQALEYILENEPDFVPSRTILVALGCDEEVGGRYGAAHLYLLLLGRYGEKGIYSIYDEGVAGISNIGGQDYAIPAIGEKGHIAVAFNLTTPGGHASVPPEHTSIGIAARLITYIEDETLPTLLYKGSQTLQLFQCIAQYSENIPQTLKNDLKKVLNDRNANDRVVKSFTSILGPEVNSMLRTTKAVTIINGGIITNAVPETVSFVVDSRIAVDSTVKKTEDLLSSKAYKIAKSFNLGLEVNEEVILPPTPQGNLVLSSMFSLEPAPLSPDNSAWRTFAGTIKSLYEEVVFPFENGNEDKDIVIVPSIMFANTDTALYWNLTDNIYRFQPGLIPRDAIKKIHSVDEHMPVRALMDSLAFTYDYIHAAQGVA
ncbi:HDL318Wp [Eremothecium sinecaudum]|uniref:HDL318Wp n=1 Tax=Eremothecium sinecaudum TaxID=45286 RepID=A0A0X8HR20_9SACH|nr:HDL318Wp [Eremothecium sinecaudum]AMD20426.1 HDL318Wp [Eremothecium sinecaudum]